MSSPKLQFDWTISLGSMVSTALWLAGAVWFVSTLTGAVTQLQKDSERQDALIMRIDREGSELARQDRRRIDELTRKQESTESTLARMADTLARIDENVKVLKEAKTH